MGQRGFESTNLSLIGIALYPLSYWTNVEKKAQESHLTNSIRDLLYLQPMRSLPSAPRCEGS